MYLKVALISILMPFSIVFAQSSLDCPPIDGHYVDGASGMKITAKMERLEKSVKYKLSPWAGDNEILVDGAEHLYSLGGQTLYQISVCEQSKLILNLVMASGYKAHQYVLIQYQFSQINKNGDLSVVTRTSAKPEPVTTQWVRSKK